MPDFCLYFQVHQPNRLKQYSFFDIGCEPFYEDDSLNSQILSEVSDRCYLPANELFLKLIEEEKADTRLTFSISGVLLEQLEHHRPDVLESFQRLVSTGKVELLCETYYHSLAFRASKDEFTRQVELQQAILKRLFNVEPQVFRHTELIYFNELGAHVESLGFKAQLAEGVPTHLDGRSPNHLYRSPNVAEMPLILRNNQLSDDLAFRFADRGWDSYPLSPQHYAEWVKESGGDVIGCFLDYETIGEHIRSEHGIFEFWSRLPQELTKQGISMKTPSEVIAEHSVSGLYDCHEPTSWADTTKDLAAWKSNPMQKEAVAKIRKMEEVIKQNSNAELLHQWAKMQTSDHFYYMFTGQGGDEEVHTHFSPYESAYDAYLYFMNALSDLQLRAQGRI